MDKSDNVLGVDGFGYAHHPLGALSTVDRIGVGLLLELQDATVGEENGEIRKILPCVKGSGMALT